MMRKQYIIAPVTALIPLTMLALGSSPGAQAAKPFKTGKELSFTCSGNGEFNPANLGAGDPEVFPWIVGDGSGFACYGCTPDSTPTGTDFRIDGTLVGDGSDQHFGTAQSVGPGIPLSGALFSYPIENGPNPDGTGRAIHIMKSDMGQIHFTYGGAFELDLDALTLTYSSDFTIVGGTKLFAGSTGTVHVSTETSIVEDGVDPDADPVVAPFRYDFDGFIVLAKQNWKGSGEGLGEGVGVLPGGTGRIDADTIAGQATHMGAFTASPESSGHNFDFLTGVIDGWAHWRAANGDEVYLTYVGVAGDNLDPETADDYPFRSDVSFTVEGGTGRFADATGQMTMDVVFTNPFLGDDPFTEPIEFPFEFEGTLNY